jgi:UPF0271 protein
MRGTVAHVRYDRYVLLELDAGEHPDEPEALWALADALNVACGGHAGDAASMARVVAFCARAGVRLGAHPSYPDRDGFGRRALAMTRDALVETIRAQCAALAAIAGALSIVHVKPHGALYHDAARDPAIADALLAGALAALGDVIVIGPSRGALAEAARARGLRYLREGFADRRTRDDGSLVPRDEPGALVVDPVEAAARAVVLRDSGEVDAICVHADTPGALAIARAVREALCS